MTHLQRILLRLRVRVHQKADIVKLQKLLTLADDAGYKTAEFKHRMG